MNRITALAAAGLVAVAATPAFADNESDIAACAAAMSADKGLDMDAYRVKFDRARGGRVRELSLEVIPLQDDLPGYDAKCSVRRGEVVELELIAI